LDSTIGRHVRPRGAGHLGITVEVFGMFGGTKTQAGSVLGTVFVSLVLFSVTPVFAADLGVIAAQTLKSALLNSKQRRLARETARFR
jgi:hypothetical protein